MNNNITNDIFFRSVEIVINSAKSLILDEWDGDIYSYSPNDKTENIAFKKFSSEFLISDNTDGKIYISACRNTIRRLAMNLYGMVLSKNESDDMLQDSLNELLNFFIGNAARELEKLGLDFIESLIPTKAIFEDHRKNYSNYSIVIPVSDGEIIFAFSINI